MKLRGLTPSLAIAALASACSATSAPAQDPGCAATTVIPSRAPTSTERMPSTPPDGGAADASTGALEIGDPLSAAYCDEMCPSCAQAIAVACSVASASPLSLACQRVGGG